MYAVIKTGGKQYRVSEGDVINVEKLNGDVGAAIEFDEVMLIGDGEDIKVGTPYLDAAKVFGSIVETGKGKKVIIFKYKAKKDYRKKQGHRQPYTAVKIERISADGEAKSTVKEALVKEEPPVAEAPELKKAEAETEAPAKKKPATKKTAEPKATADDKPEAPKKTTAKRASAKKSPDAEKTE